MAAHAETWQKVLDGTDDETMKLILQLQRAEARTCDGDQPSDFEVARSLHITELELYRANRYPGSPEPTPPPSPSQIAPRSPPQQVSVPLATQPSRKRAASTEIGEQPAKVFKTTHKTTHEAAKQLTCVICLDEFDANGGLKVTCGHFYCASHLQHLFSLAMKQQVSYPPRCCKQIVPYQDASLFLDPKLAAEFSSKSVELDDTKRVYCHVASCSAYIRHADRDGTLATCPSCGMETCISCKQAKHVGDCKADTAVEGIMALAKSEAWQQCYSFVSAKLSSATTAAFRGKTARARNGMSIVCSPAGSRSSPVKVAVTPT
ncbi:hypothetical protein LTR09_008254 [Extremus antarcticus]|uniref:IBR domain-containing protein n=1 Tax=Extremus antarcticus TaxID=702011 RepID=A0AAJ0DI39_9PEZI|nr:hypothetical protein LTR09_008254 [Extremus antarcticus]